MKQPQLGKKIAELRQSKGLTQEELVALCNINVRTIQRIEAGEVTPRNYTLRLIWEVLGMPSDELGSVDDQPTIPLNKQRINMGIIGGIAYLLTYLPASIFDFVRFTDDVLIDGQDILAMPYYILVKSMSTLGLIAMMWGFVELARFTSEAILKVGATTLLIVVFVTGTLDIATLGLDLYDWSDVIIIFAELGLLAISGILFGIGLIMSRRSFGDLAIIAGILEISIAVFVMSMSWAMVALVVLLPAIIIELVLLYRVVRQV